jgi:hypothetical protein
MAYKQNSPKPVVEGGSGIITTNPYAPIVGGTTAAGNLQQVASAGSTGQTLRSNGSGSLPTWRTAAGAGDLILLNTQTQSGMVKNVIWDGTYINGTYQCYLVVFDNFTFSGSSPESIIIGFSTSSTPNVPSRQAGLNYWPYNSSTVTNVHTSGGDNVVYRFTGYDQGQGYLYINIGTAAYSPPPTWFGQFTGYSSTLGSATMLAGGSAAQPYTGAINLLGFAVYNAGYWTNVTASLYGFQQ